MYRFVLILAVLSTAAVADTKSEEILNCDAVRDSGVLCVACNIYHEARGEHTVGQLAIGLVTRNRVESKHYPDTYCGVVWEARRDKNTRKIVPMFSWTRDGKHDKIYNTKKWTEASKLASHIVHGDVTDITLGSQWYHRNDINPYWAPHYYPTVRIGNHQFYTSKEKQFNMTVERIAFQ